MVYELKSKVALKKNKAEITNILPKRNLQRNYFNPCNGNYITSKYPREQGLSKIFLLISLKRIQTQST